MSFKVAATLVGAFASVALGHGTVTGIKVDGTYHGGYKLDYYYAKQNGQEVPSIAAWSAENLDNGFVAPDAYTTSDISCHKNSAPGASSVSVKAGGSVEFQWSDWPDSHFGPVFTYVAKCDGDCTSADPATLKWVKIDEGGIDIAAQKWAATDLIENNNTWVTTVPETLAAGSYVFRHEIIAMHGAGETNGAQNYPQCFNIDITGGGSDNPEGVLGTELYTPTDAGIKFNPYGQIDSYEIPGPALYGSGSGSAPTATVPAGNSTLPVQTPVAGTPVAAPSSIVTSVVVPTQPAATQPAATAVEGAPTSAAAEPEAPSYTQPATGNTGSGSGSDASANDNSEGSGSGSSLPETFTLETFISWLRSNASSKKARRHARDIKH